MESGVRIPPGVELIFSTFLHFDIECSLSGLLRRCISTYVATTTKSIPSCVAWGEAILIQHGKKVIIPVNEGLYPPSE